MEQMRQIQLQFTSSRNSQVKFDDQWIKEQAESKISDSDFTKHVFTLQTKNLITVEATKNILIKFGELRKDIILRQNKLLSYDAKWAKEQAKTNMSKNDFKYLLDDLEESKDVKMSRRKARELLDEFKRVR